MDETGNAEVTDTAPTGFVARILGAVERAGNKLPDPAMLFALLLVTVWVASWILSYFDFSAIDPRTGNNIEILNLLSGSQLANFLATMVPTFTGFAPLGVVLVAMLGVGVAEHSGFINVGLKLMLNVTPQKLLTPMLILVAIVSHTAVDAGYVLVIPLGGVLYYAAGRHPLAGIAAAFAGVSGGFSANFIPSAIDPLLQSFTQSAAQIVEPGMLVNPLNNIYFTAASSILIVLVGWFLTDKVIEPRLQGSEIDGDEEDMPIMETPTAREIKSFWISIGVMVIGLVLLALALLPETSPLRTPDGEITSFSAPIMQAIVPLIFLLFFVPGTVFGYVSGHFKDSRDLVGAMTKAMDDMAYYIVIVFFIALFVNAFTISNIGTLLSVEGGTALAALGLPGPVTIVGLIFLVGFTNLLVGSASAKWALLAPIFVPMLMQLGFSPDLTQAAYRVGDSTTNIITPLMPYFPLVVVYCQRYVKGTGIGTLTSIMLPYSVTFIILWSLFLVAYWQFGLPLGLQASYVYP